MRSVRWKTAPPDRRPPGVPVRRSRWFRPSRRAGVPVFSLPRPKPSVQAVRKSRRGLPRHRRQVGRQPVALTRARPAGIVISPRWINPAGMPVVRTTRPAPSLAPDRFRRLHIFQLYRSIYPLPRPRADIEVRLLGQQLLHGLPIELAVGLCPRPATAGPFDRLRVRN